MTRRLRDTEILDSLTDALARLEAGRMPRPLRRTLSAPGDPTPLYDDLCAGSRTQPDQPTERTQP